MNTAADCVRVLIYTRRKQQAVDLASDQGVRQAAEDEEPVIMALAM